MATVINLNIRDVLEIHSLREFLPFPFFGNCSCHRLDVQCLQVSMQVCVTRVNVLCSCELFLFSCFITLVVLLSPYRILPHQTLQVPAIFHAIIKVPVLSGWFEFRILHRVQSTMCKISSVVRCSFF